MALAAASRAASPSAEPRRSAGRAERREGTDRGGRRPEGPHAPERRREAGTAHDRDDGFRRGGSDRRSVFRTDSARAPRPGLPGRPATALAGPAPSASPAALTAPASVSSPAQAPALGWHASPDLLTNHPTAARIDAELDAAAAQGAANLTVVVDVAHTPPELLAHALDAAADRGLRLELRTIDAGWKHGTPARWDAETGRYAYDPAAGAHYREGLQRQLGGLTERQRAAIGSLQIGNEPLDPKEHDRFVGEDFGHPSQHAARYEAWLSAHGGGDPQALADRVARSMGLATRDLLADLGPSVAELLGPAHAGKLAVPAMGAGHTRFNDVNAQREFYLGVMGVELDGRRGPSGLAHAQRIGSHAYVAAPDGANPIVFSSTEGYERALEAYRGAFGGSPAGADTARPVWTELGLDNRFRAGQGALLGWFQEQVVGGWNARHPAAPSAGATVWGWDAGYAHESEWRVTDPGLGRALAEEGRAAAAGDHTGAIDAPAGPAPTPTAGGVRPTGPVGPIFAGRGFAEGGARVEHLGPDENGGRHHILLDTGRDGDAWRVLDREGRVLAEGVTETKNGRPGQAEIPMYKWDGASVEVNGVRVASDLTAAPDVPDAGGNTRFHHSWRVTYREGEALGAGLAVGGPSAGGPSRPGAPTAATGSAGGGGGPAGPRAEQTRPTGASRAMSLDPRLLLAWLAWLLPQLEALLAGLGLDAGAGLGRGGAGRPEAMAPLRVGSLLARQRRTIAG